ncbi:MAG TPA: FecR domain-containing protein [Polyangiaceae bacterium]|jgi:TolA-binding protein|nr:FecR domain-containing protein [Polyangiaceae bacterium]
MTADGSPNADVLVEQLVELAREASSTELSPQESAGLHRLELALVARKRRSPALKLAIVAAAIAVAVSLFVFLGRDRPLTYEVANAAVSEGGYVATAAVQAYVRFSDRSEIEVAPATSVRVSDLEVHGARVMLEGGLLHVRIRPQRRTSWTLEAGPYVVHVTGTEFDLAWRVDEQVLDLRLHKGSVIVEGPLADAGVRVSAGQHLVANHNAGTLSLVDELSVLPASSEAPPPAMAAAPSASPAPALAPSPIDVAPSTRPRDLGPTAKSRAEAPSWQARVAHGDFDGIVADAERRGLDRVLTESTATDLAALADAARYARREEVARRALSAQRTRYPGSTQARDAAFFLGGLAEGQKADTAALEWYDSYLGESPDGAYASQALGRKMMLLERLHGPRSARAVAAEYLARFPEGPYAGSASKLLSAQ